MSSGTEPAAIRGAANAEEGDDLDAYVATFSKEERRDLVAAEAAIDVAILLHRARARRGLSQREAAELAGLRQQAVSRFEQPDANPQLETVHAYLAALGYALELNAIDVGSGQVAASALLPPHPPRARRRTVRIGTERARDRPARAPGATSV